ncbi:MAG: hypothetical protein KF802_12695 [Bdellovibrionaceae bacterium]|nr:hypothetical protein [Pseudobdellovibrionaceae bacterium]MBX3034830.1 hypothetical protein [Pseudobdellovibrionaceae bacterium]
MKSLCFFLGLILSLPAWAETPAPFLVDEDVRFIGRDAPLGSLFRSHNYLGTFVRREASINGFTNVGVFVLDPVAKKSVDSDVCQAAARLILGSLEEPMRLKGMDYFSHNLVKGCEVMVYDGDPQTPQPARRIFVKPFNGRFYAFAVGLPRVHSNYPSEEIRQFIGKLALNPDAVRGPSSDQGKTKKAAKKPAKKSKTAQ